MSLFTESEAKACKIWKTEKDGNTWIIGVQDGNRLYDFVFDNLGDDPSNDLIKSKVLEELVKKPRLEQRNINVIEKDSDGNPITYNKGIGDTLG